MPGDLRAPHPAAIRSEGIVQGLPRGVDVAVQTDPRGKDTER